MRAYKYEIIATAKAVFEIIFSALLSIFIYVKLILLSMILKTEINFSLILSKSFDVIKSHLFYQLSAALKGVPKKLSLGM